MEVVAGILVELENNEQNLQKPGSGCSTKHWEVGLNPPWAAGLESWETTLMEFVQAGKLKEEE